MIRAELSALIALSDTSPSALGRIARIVPSQGVRLVLGQGARIALGDIPLIPLRQIALIGPGQCARFALKQGALIVLRKIAMMSLNQVARIGLGLRVRFELGVSGPIALQPWPRVERNLPARIASRLQRRIPCSRRTLQGARLATRTECRVRTASGRCSPFRRCGLLATPGEAFGRLVAEALTQLLLVSRLALGALRLGLRERGPRAPGAGAGTAHRRAIGQGPRCTGAARLLEFHRGHARLEHAKQSAYTPRPNSSRSASRYWRWPRPLVL